MSMIFGPVAQIGYIVRDLDEAVKYWTEVLGVGPFFVTPLEFEYYSFEGVASSPKLRLAFGYSGPLQIELIQQLNDAPSAYKDFLDREGPGMHHVCTFCENYDEDIKRFEKDGLAVLMEGKTANADPAAQVRFKFYQTGLHNGSFIEVADIPLAKRAGLDYMQTTAAQWDGTDPVRSFG